MRRRRRYTDEEEAEVPKHISISVCDPSMMTKMAQPNAPPPFVKSFRP